MTIYSRSSLQILDNWFFWMKKDKGIPEFNRRTR